MAVPNKQNIFHLLWYWMTATVAKGVGGGEGGVMLFYFDTPVFFFFVFFF